MTHKLNEGHLSRGLKELVDGGFIDKGVAEILKSLHYIDVKNATDYAINTFSDTLKVEFKNSGYK